LKLQSSPSRQLNILVADDEFGTRASLGIVLALAGHHTIFARDGDEAFDLVEQDSTRFDLIITDHQMFRVSGLELVRKLRQKGYPGQIIVLTAYAGIVEKEDYGKLNVACIMDKPFDTAGLRERIEDCFAVA